MRTAVAMQFTDSAEPLVPGDVVYIRAEVRRVEHGGGVVIAAIPSVIGEGLNYVAAPPRICTRIETRIGVKSTC